MVKLAPTEEQWGCRRRDDPVDHPRHRQSVAARSRSSTGKEKGPSPPPHDDEVTAEAAVAVAAVAAVDEPPPLFSPLLALLSIAAAQLGKIIRMSRSSTHSSLPSEVSIGCGGGRRSVDNSPPPPPPFPLFPPPLPTPLPLPPPSPALAPPEPPEPPSPLVSLSVSSSRDCVTHRALSSRRNSRRMGLSQSRHAVMGVDVSEAVASLFTSAPPPPPRVAIIKWFTE